METETNEDFVNKFAKIIADHIQQHLSSIVSKSDCEQYYMTIKNRKPEEKKIISKKKEKFELPSIPEEVESYLKQVKDTFNRDKSGKRKFYNVATNRLVFDTKDTTIVELTRDTEKFSFAVPNNIDYEKWKLAENLIDNSKKPNDKDTVDLAFAETSFDLSSWNKSNFESKLPDFLAQRKGMDKNKYKQLMTASLKKYKTKFTSDQKEKLLNGLDEESPLLENVYEEDTDDD